MRIVRLCAIACVALLVEVPLAAQQGARRGEWTVLGGDKAYTKYTPLDQINKMHNGRQYIVIPIGSRTHAGAWVAPSLP